MSAAGNGSEKPAMQLHHATQDNSPFVSGRRTFFKYRDLGVTDATHGVMRAQVMSAIDNGMTEPTGWHYHECEGQFVYTLKGWVDLEFETGETIHMVAGDSMFIPGGLRHNEIATSDDVEILEVSIPADMGTVPCEKPAEMTAQA